MADYASTTQTVQASGPVALTAAGADASLTNKSGRKPADYVTDKAIASLLG